MWITKGCPKCKGDLFISLSNNNGRIETCLQCGFERELVKPTKPVEPPDLIPAVVRRAVR